MTAGMNSSDNRSVARGSIQGAARPAVVPRPGRAIRLASVFYPLLLVAERKDQIVSAGDRNDWARHG